MPPAYHALFADDAFPIFEITLPQSSIDTLGSEAYQPGTLRYGDIVIENVGVRSKGRSTQQGFDGKPSLKIKVNEFVSGQRLLGLKRLTLNNMIQDPSMAHERLGYAVFRAAGVPAPLCNHARVYINGVYFGLYANVQTLDEVFVKEHWDPAPGNLYDIVNDGYGIDFEREQACEPPQETKFVLETNEDVNDTSDLTALIEAVSMSRDDSFLSAVEAVMNLDEVLALGAVQAVIADFDGYFGARNNFKAYHELAQDRFILLPWGIDQTFGAEEGSYNKLDYAIDHSGSERQRSLLYDRCANNPQCQMRYEAQVALALAAFEGLDLETQLDAILAQVATAIAEDTRKPYSAQTHLNSVSDLRDFLSMRADIVRDQLR